MAAAYAPLTTPGAVEHSGQTCILPLLGSRVSEGVEQRIDNYNWWHPVQALLEWLHLFPTRLNPSSFLGAASVVMCHTHRAMPGANLLCSFHVGTWNIPSFLWSPIFFPFLFLMFYILPIAPVGQPQLVRSVGDVLYYRMNIKS